MHFTKKKKMVRLHHNTADIPADELWCWGCDLEESISAVRIICPWISSSRATKIRATAVGSRPERETDWLCSSSLTYALYHTCSLISFCLQFAAVFLIFVLGGESILLLSTSQCPSVCLSVCPSLCLSCIFPTLGPCFNGVHSSNSSLSVSLSFSLVR